MISITVKGDRDTETKRRRFGQLSKKLPQDVSRSLKGRLHTAIVGVALNRGLIGSTGNVVKKDNWIVHAKPKGDHHWIVTASNPKAPYASYLNRPSGPYPFEIKLGKLRSWMSRKSHDRANWPNVRALAAQIEDEGHKTKKGKGFLREALNRTLSGYPPIFKKIVRDRVKA